MRTLRWLMWLAVALGALGCDFLKGDPGKLCTDECALGQVRCDPEGQRVACAGPDAEGCTHWSTPEACGLAQACSAGECACANPCQAGQSVCAADGRLQRCAGPDADGCLAWGAPEDCPVGLVCAGGACDCGGPCQPGESACDLTGALVSCEGPDPEGCTRWGAPVACPERQRCDAEARACVCADPCQAGEVACLELVGVIACAAPDEAGCLAWGELAPCPAGSVCLAEELACVEVASPECEGENECDFPGQKVCMTDVKYRECKVGLGGCLELDCSS